MTLNAIKSMHFGAVAPQLL